MPSLLHQDPRYFVHYNANFSQRVRYAVRRMVVTRNDNGEEVFNWSGIIGPVLAESLANSYLPQHEQTAAKTFEPSGVRIGFAAANNLLKNTGLPSSRVYASTELRPACSPPRPRPHRRRAESQALSYEKFENGKPFERSPIATSENSDQRREISFAPPWPQSYT